MLILKAPLTLLSLSGFGIRSDSLGEKIYGNYQVFGTALAGEDLIHMTMQEPEIYVGIQNNGPFLVDNQIHADNKVRLELVNQLINRIMLYDSPEFTYQDEVFVASVLQKLGVADVKEFMELVKLHMEKNERTVELLDRYFEQGRELAYMVNGLLESQIHEKQDLEIIKNQYRSDRYLHNQVFKRLMTAECSNSVYSYQNPVRTREGVVRSFHNMEWMRMADRIQLSQLRENIFNQTDPAVFCDFFTYETKPLTVNELTQRKVIGRMSAAILENLVHAVGYALQYEYGNTRVWKHYGKILYGSSENTLERFRCFQSGSGVGAERVREYVTRMNELTRDELQLAQLLEFADRYDILQENDTIYGDMTRNIVLSLLENQNLQKQLTREIRMMPPERGWDQPDRYYLEERNTYIQERNRFERAYRVLRQSQGVDSLYTVLEGEAGDVQLPEEDGAPGLLAALYEEIARQEQRAQAEGQRQWLEPASREAVPGEGGGGRPGVLQEPDREPTVYQIVREYASSGNTSAVPLMENRELLEQINQHNIHMRQLLEDKGPATDTPRRVVVDRTQAREAALRALEEPGQVLREVYENAAGRERIPDVIPGEIERILSVTDESTRSFYERLMGYRDGETSQTEAEAGKEGEDRPRPAAPDPEAAEEEKQYLETIREVLQTTDTETLELYRRGMTYRNAELVHPQETPVPERTLTQEERERLEELQGKVYLLLRRIRRKESAYRINREYTAAQTREVAEHTRRELLRQDRAELHDIDISEMISAEHLHAVQREDIQVFHAAEKEIQLVHRTREQIRQEMVEEALETLENSTVTRKSVDKKLEETLLTQRQLEEIRNELVSQSRDQVTRMVESSVKTQVHEISDMVYLELERRLKNEQRRRGY